MSAEESCPFEKCSCSLGTVDRNTDKSLVLQQHVENNLCGNSCHYCFFTAIIITITAVTIMMYHNGQLSYLRIPLFATNYLIHYCIEVHNIHTCHFSNLFNLLFL